MSLRPGTGSLRVRDTPGRSPAAGSKPDPTSASAIGRKGISQFGRVHDAVLFYTKSRESTWNAPATPQDESNVRGHDIMRDAAGKPYRVSDFSGAGQGPSRDLDRKSTRLNSSHLGI